MKCVINKKHLKKKLMNTEVKPIPKDLQKLKDGSTEEADIKI